MRYDFFLSATGAHPETLKGKGRKASAVRKLEIWLFWGQKSIILDANLAIFESKISHFKC